MRFGKYLYGSGCLLILGIVYGTMGSDSGPILSWWLTLFLLGIGFYPLSKKLFGSFTDHGYIFGKVLGFLLSGYLMFLLGSLHILKFTKGGVLVSTLVAVALVWGITFLTGKKEGLKKIFEEQFGLWVKIWRKRSVLNSVITVILGTLNAVFRLGVYVFLFFEFYQNKIDVSNFVLYFGVITGFNSWLQSFVSNIEGLNRISYDIDDLHRFMEEGAAEGSTDSVPEDTDNAIEVDNLHFAYTKDDEGTEEKATEVIRGMNFRIKKGEKIGIVGPNGSGKTTLVKLICGLYRPSSGTVKVCGYDTSTTNKETIYNLISPVFQDVYMLPTTISRNITMTPFADTEKLTRCIEDSGLEDKIERLPDGAETIIVKSVHEEAIQLSGGETQKLALARALYKGGKVLILDEPTAALDPLAESEMYQKYGKLTEGVASIFISHRLASTRFCDRIFLIENGVIAEEGTHDELMALGGKYAAMFEVQSRYYRDSPGAAEL